MKEFLKKIGLQLIYMTPIGYLINFSKLQIGEYVPGIYIELSPDYPIKATVKENPSLKERFNWFFNGFILISQSLFLASDKFWDKIMTVLYSQDIWSIVVFTYIGTGLIYGILCILTPIFPTFNWNKSIFFGKITILEITVFITLITSAFLTVAL